MANTYHLTEEQQALLRPYVQQLLSAREMIAQIVKFAYGEHASLDLSTMIVTTEKSECSEE